MNLRCDASSPYKLVDDKTGCKLSLTFVRLNYTTVEASILNYEEAQMLAVRTYKKRYDIFEAIYNKDLVVTFWA